MKEKQINLNGKQEKALIALLTESTIKQAANKSGVGEATLYRWLNEEDFSQAYKEARSQALTQTISRIQQSTNTAVNTLNDIMTDTEASASSRVTAAKTILEMAFKAHEIENVVSKIEEMEKALELQEA